MGGTGVETLPPIRPRRPRPKKRGFCSFFGSGGSDSDGDGDVRNPFPSFTYILLIRLFIRAAKSFLRFYLSLQLFSTERTR